MTLIAFSKTSGATIVLAAALLALTGCSSAPDTRDLMVEEAHAAPVERPIAMKGDATYVDGTLYVVATVERGFQRIGKGGEPIKGSGPRGGKGGHWGGKHDADAYSEDYNFGVADTEEQQKEAMQEYMRQAMARRAAGSPMPPVTLHVVFENRGTAPMEVEPTDVNSDLGNFAVRPAKLVLAPGEKAALDPMISQLGVTSDLIPLTVSIRVGKRKETQVLQVKNVLSPTVLKAVK